MSLDIAVESDFPDDRRSQAAATQALRNELRRQGVIADPPPEPPRQNSKSGGAAAIGELVVTGLLSATTLNAAARVAIAFVNRKSARKIVITSGEHRLEIVGELEPAQRELLALMLGAADRS